MIDLHMHTTASDGVFSVAEVLKKCEDAKLDMISITDHYSVGGYEDLKDPKVRSIFSGKILAGCEFSVHFKGINIEILGYGIEIEAARAYISKTYLSFKEKAKAELKEMLALYPKRGLIFDPDKHYENRMDLKDEMMRYPENRARLTDPRSLENPAIFLRREIGNPESPFFRSVENTMPAAKEVCDMIRAWGGKSVVAHPGIYHPAVYDHLEELITESGVDGLEIWYPSHTPEQREHLLALCKKYRLIHSGGSDYHRPEREVRGNIIGNPWLKDAIPLKDILAWTEALKKI